MSISSLRHFRVDVPSTGLITVWIDVLGRSVNVLFDEVFGELETLVSTLESTTSLPVLFRSAKSKGFIVGADLKRIAAIRTDAEIQEFLQRGQIALSRMEASPLRTIALIQGPCLGGGLEFSLACKSRIACNHPDTILGMPESKIGLMPGWGGTQRLIERIGLRPGLNMLLSGEPVNANQAFTLGLTDTVLEETNLDARLSQWLDQPAEQPDSGSHPPPSTPTTESTIDWLRLRQEFILDSDSAQAIFDAVKHGRMQSREAGFQAERQSFFRLLQSAEAQACLRRFA